MISQIHIIAFPTKEEVHCADGVVGRSIYAIGNLNKDAITDLVVESNRSPFHQYLIPVEQVDVMTDGLIKLKCTLDDLNQMKLYEYEECIRNRLHGYLRWEGVSAIPGFTPGPVTTFIPMKGWSVPQDELTLRHDAIVNATDGYVGKVDKLLIDSINMHITHLVLVVRHIFDASEIIIPVSQVDHTKDDTIYLKLDRQGIKELVTAPAQYWSL